MWIVIKMIRENSFNLGKWKIKRKWELKMTSLKIVLKGTKGKNMV